MIAKVRLRRFGAALAISPALFLTGEVEAATIRVRIVDLAYFPTEIHARVGDTIEWTNEDAFDHTATERQGGWEVTIPAAATGSLVLKEEGAFDYFCRYHPNMRGRIKAAPH